MNILLFGSTGFIGRHLCHHLMAAGHTVAAPDRYTPLVSIKGTFDAVIDLAWNGVPARFRNDYALQAGNVARFGNLIANLQRWNPRVFIGFGSQAEYGGYADRGVFGGLSFQTTQPQCAYGVAKLSCSNFLFSAPRKIKQRHCWLRLFSVYGPGEGDGWLLPTTIRKMRSGDPLEFTPGEQEMDYLHVTDVCRAVNAILEQESFWGCHDLASGHPLRLRHIIETLADIEKPTQPLHFGALPYRPGQVMRMCGERSIWRTLGIEPSIELREGLRGVCESIQ